MSIQINDRIKETSNTTGIIPIVLQGAANGFNSIASSITSANTFPYVIETVGGTEWEIGVGLYISSNNSILRTQVLNSSNNSNIVDFSSGLKNVFVTIPAAYSALSVRDLSQFAPTTSAQLASVISDETGSGKLVFSNNAVLVAPDIGIANGTTLTLSGDLNVTGNVYLSGNVTTLSSNNLSVSDPLIYLGQNNPANLQDIGIVGHFTTTKYQHTGLVRDATDGVWKLFSNVSTEPTTTIDFTNAIYDGLQVGTLNTSNATFAATSGQPFTVLSTTAVTNLNADYLDGQHGSYYTGLTGLAWDTANTKFASSGGTISGSLIVSTNLTVNGNSSFGDISNVHISGGNTEQFLITDGYGNLSFIDFPTPNTVVYLANSIIQSNGVYVSGNVSSLQTFGDYASGNTYVLTDGSGAAPAWELDFDFLGVSRFNRVVMNINYTQSSGHTIYVQLYNIVTQIWDSIGTYTGLGSYYAFALDVIDHTNYISSGRVQLRLYHSNSGNVSHTTNVDYVGLEQSYQGPQGPRGPQGATGATGPGLAAGGTQGQLLLKNSSTNYDTVWSNTITSVTLNGLTNFLVSSGLAPFSVNSNIIVTNLNADYLDGQHGSYYTGLSDFAYTQANTGVSIAQSAYTQANTSNTVGTSALLLAQTKVTNFYQNTSPTSANTKDAWIHSDTGVKYENVGNTSNPIWIECGPTGVADNLVPGVVSATSIVSSNVTANSIVSSNGVYSTGTYTGSYTDGIVLDYVNGNGRISVGGNDGIKFYSGGVGANTLLTLSSAGQIYSTYNGANGGATLMLTGNNTIGGTYYFDFLRVINGASGVTNQIKTMRLNSTGGLEIIDSTYGNIIFTLTDNGNITNKGTIIPGAYSAGQVIKDVMLSNNEVTVVSTTIAATNSNVNFITYNYTPVSSSSYLLIHYHLSKYAPAGTTVDSWYSALLVDGNEIAYGWQMVNNSNNGTSGRSGVLFPLTGRYTNSSTSVKQIQVAARRDSADDSIAIDNSSTSMWLRITEVAR